MHSSTQALAWGDLEFLLAVCRAGSLSGAARRLGVNHSTVFRRVNAIEDNTGVRFFERLPSGYRMTEAGETALIHAERIESEMHALGREVLGQDQRLEGPVRVTAPEGMTSLLLPELMVLFARAHPGVRVEMTGTAAALDLSRREAEVAIRATRKPPEFALGRRVCPFRFGIYGAPDYLAEHADEPVTEQDWIMLPGLEGWLVPHVFKRERDVKEAATLASSSIISIINMTVAGGGLTMLPFYLGEAHPQLSRVGQAIEALTLNLWVLTHPDLKHTTRVRVLMDYLYEELRRRRSLFEGEA
jgi:DNA-binding transcriptional LysR family regulator